MSCKKSNLPSNNAEGGTGQLIYGDSIFYLKNQSSDYIVSPLNSKTGNYVAFPEGLVIDNSSGAINITKSESGLRYRITYKSTTGDSSSTFIVISGINFPDKYYHLANSDSVAFPVYNADPSKPLPTGSFDDDKVATNSGCAIKTNNGQINLIESIRNGLFGPNPKNNTKKNFDIKYRLNDKSGNTSNKINVLIYYYNTMNDVPQDLTQTIQDHQAMTLQPNNTPVSGNSLSVTAKPRPPCIVIIAH